MNRRRITALALGLAVLIGAPIPADGQDPRRRRRGFGAKEEKLVKKFDADKNGTLDDEERKAARKHIRKKRGARAPAKPAEKKPEKEVPAEAETVKESGKFPHDATAGLYDETVLRTLHLRFPDGGWHEELADFYRTDVDVPADLVVDGQVYRSVGVSFRGNSSYFMTGSSNKKSLNIFMDHADPDQSLLGYRTLNLLNGHADPSFIREVLYSRICRNYLPAPKANFVRLTVNGEYWGVFVSIQQFNRDFLRDWFGTRQGVRWKITPSMSRRGGGGSLVWSGADLAAYKAAYQLKTGGATDDAWKALANLCRTLNETPDQLGPVFDADRALWMIALENVFIDSDGYVSRGSDYNLYMHPGGRFHMIPYDNNETFRFAGGGGPNMWPNRDPMLDPLAHEETSRLPVISKLLRIPHLRARYLAHMRTIIDEWLDWDVLGPIIEEYRSLIDEAVKEDGKKLYPYRAFADAATKDPPAEPRRRRGGRPPPSFKRFVSERREFLLKHPEMAKTAPAVAAVSHKTSPDGTVKVRAKVGGDAEPGPVLLHFAAVPHLPFESISMS
ncbi:MAG: CotH kinase family protein, partial [Planctomycetota bacterium]